MNLDSKVKELMYSSGVDEYLSTLLVEFTGGDVEGARKIVDAMPKNYIAIKIRFMAHKTHYYGAILIVVDIKNKTFENMFLIADKNTLASQIDNTLRFEEFKEKIIRYLKEQDPDMVVTGRLREAIEKNEFKEKVFFRLVKEDKFDIEELKVVFLELFSRILTEQNCALKIETEGVDLFRIYKSSDKYKVQNDNAIDNSVGSESSEDRAVREEVHIRNISLVLLKAEPVLSPVSGIPANDLQVGDAILVKIIDDREIGDYLAKLLNGKDHDQLVPISAIIKEIEKQEDTENLMVRVQFGPGIAGRMIITPEVKIETSEFKENEFDDQNAEGFNFSKVNPLWIIFILIILFIIFLIYTFFISR